MESGLVSMDNNAAERALTHPILGRKAWLFFGNQSAGETAAKLFTLIKSCNRHRVDPLTYLRAVYARLPTMPPDESVSLLPDRWIQGLQECLIQERVQESLNHPSVRANGAPCGCARQPDRTSNGREDSIRMSRSPIHLELLPHERAALLKFCFGTGICDQLEACASSSGMQTMTINRLHPNWLASDLTHEIVKRGCRDLEVRTYPVTHLCRKSIFECGLGA